MRRVHSSLVGRSSTAKRHTVRLSCQALGDTAPTRRAKSGRQFAKRLCVETLEKALKRRGPLAATALTVLTAEANNPSGPSTLSAVPAAQQQQQYMSLRFSSIEFRSLALTPLAKSGLMAPFPDRGIWNRHKVELAQLVMDLASSSSEKYEARLLCIVDKALDRELSHLHRQLQDQANADERERLQKRHETRHKKVQAQLSEWCESTVRNPKFQVLKPVLEKVLEVEPAPQVDTKRDGQQTEMAISQMLLRELPPGWRIHTQCRLVAVDGEVFRNEKMVKGEADVLMVDLNGIVQAILEVKTAKGNPYLALYEDLQRFRNMTERVRGKLVAFVPAFPPMANHNNQAAATPDGQAAAATAVPSLLAAEGGQPGLGMAAADGKGSGQPRVVTLRFSKNVRKVYVLGSSITPEEMNSVAHSAQSKLMSLEFGRVLSTQIDAWRQVTLVEVNREAAVLQVPHWSFSATSAACRRNIRKFYTDLQQCDIFLAPVA